MRTFSLVATYWVKNYNSFYTYVVSHAPAPRTASSDYYFILAHASVGPGPSYFGCRSWITICLDLLTKHIFRVPVY